ncbi:MAG: serine/threonine protein kinase [Acidobacteria bacterium]|nr:serine/threonine protein kinase [Acidobacteriota bacterium]
MPLTIGQTVNGYELLDYLDSSSKRIAFRARNVANQRIEQLLILPDGVQHDPERSARFFRESRILASLQHPNILTCYGVVELGGRLAISVEAIEAVTLSDRLELGPMETEEAVQSILQVLAAADAAHTSGVIHREISPANILITPEKLVKLTGFSAAKTATDPSVTRAGTLVGSATYTAPEVFHGVTALDPRIDVYSIGCVFYALVTGRPPFTQTSEYEVMLAHVQAPPEPPSRYNPAINGVLDAVILKALEKDPNARYQSVREFYHSILNPGTVYIPPPPVVPVVEPAAELPAPPVLTEPAVSPAWIALGIGALLLLIGVWVLLRSGA